MNEPVDPDLPGKIMAAHIDADRSPRIAPAAITRTAYVDAFRAEVERQAEAAKRRSRRALIAATITLLAAVVVLVVSLASDAGAHEGHGLGEAYPNDPHSCELVDFDPEVVHAICHGVSVDTLRQSLVPPEVDVSSVPDSVSVGNGTFVVPDDIRRAVAAYVPPEHQEATVRVGACESGFDVFARNGSMVGAWQHYLPYLVDRLARFGAGTVADYLAGDAATQVRVTEGLRAEQGWRPWAASARCSGVR